MWLYSPVISSVAQLVPCVLFNSTALVLSFMGCGLVSQAVDFYLWDACFHGICCCFGPGRGRPWTLEIGFPAGSRSYISFLLIIACVAFYKSKVMLCVVPSLWEEGYTLLSDRSSFLCMLQYCRTRDCLFCISVFNHWIFKYNLAWTDLCDMTFSIPQALGLIFLVPNSSIDCMRKNWCLSLNMSKLSLSVRAWSKFSLCLLLPRWTVLYNTVFLN